MSRRSTSQLDHAFTVGSVASLLYEKVKSIKPTDEYDDDFRRSVILIELDIPQHRLDVECLELCLSELGIGLIEPLTEKTDK